MSFSYIKEFFQNIVIETELKPTNEVSKNTLQSILELFIRARSMVYLKDKGIYILKIVISYID